LKKSGVAQQHKSERCFSTFYPTNKHANAALPGHPNSFAAGWLCNTFCLEMLLGLCIRKSCAGAYTSLTAVKAAGIATSQHSHTCTQHSCFRWPPAACIGTVHPHSTALTPQALHIRRH
jgi:hypothetical protein